MTKRKRPGRPKLSKGETHRHTVYFPSKQYREIKREAERRGVSINTIVRERCSK